VLFRPRKEKFGRDWKVEILSIEELKRSNFRGWFESSRWMMDAGYPLPV